MEVEGQYGLSQQLIGHSKGVRCVCVLPDGRLLSGGQDGLVILWAKEEETGKFKVQKQLEHHTNFVYAVCASAIHDPLTFYTGGYDKRIFRLSADGDPFMQFEGHQGPVCSLLENGKALFSGSWDGTAKVWSLETGACDLTLSGHTHAVSLNVLVNGEVVTGSQDKCLRFWKNGHCHKVVTDAHEDIIRGICVFSSGVLTCSNDGVVKLWTLEGEEMKQIPAHSSYIYDVKASLNERPDGLPSHFYSVSDDRSLKVWEPDNSDPSQVLMHAKTVFQVAVLPNSDVLTACEDGVLRLWTKEEKRYAPAEERAAQSEQAEQAAVELQQKGAEAIDAANLPDASMAPTMRGIRIGQTKLFKEGNSAVVYQWNGQGWDKLGEVVGKAPGQEGNTPPMLGGKRQYEGDRYFEAGEYDYVFDVEIGEGSGYKKLPYRRGENPLLVAEKFCVRENIGKSAVDQVAGFIRQNTGQGTPLQQQYAQGGGGGAAPKAAPSAPAAPKAAAPTAPGGAKSKHFPIHDILTFQFQAAKVIDPLFKKLKELDAELPEGTEYKLDANDHIYFQEMIARFKNPNFLKQEFRRCEMHIIFEKFIRWEASKAFPVMDLWRIMALHPKSADLHKASDDGWQYIAHALFVMKQDINGPGCMLGCRYLSNLFVNPTNKSVMIRRCPQVLDALSDLAGSTNKNVRAGAATVLVNYAVSFRDSHKEGTLDDRLQLLSLGAEFLQNENDPESCYRLFAALGTLLLSPAEGFGESLLESAKALEVGAAVAKAASTCGADARVQEAARDLQGILK